MTIQTNDSVTREDIVARFNSRLRDWVGTHVTIFASTPYTASHRVWDGTPGSQSRGSTTGSAYKETRTLNTTAGAIASGSSAVASAEGYTGTGQSATLTNDPVPAEVMTVAGLSGDIGATSTTAGHVVKVMRDLIREYAKIQKVTFDNVGNLEPLKWTGVVKASNTPSIVNTKISNDIDAYLLSTNFKSGAALDPVKFLAFIEQCRTIWQTRCLNTTTRVFYFNYCHSSCHSNETCYNSRGRR